MSNYEKKPSSASSVQGLPQAQGSQKVDTSHVIETGNPEPYVDQVKEIGSKSPGSEWSEAETELDMELYGDKDEDISVHEIKKNYNRR